MKPESYRLWPSDNAGHELAFDVMPGGDVEVLLYPFADHTIRTVRVVIPAAEFWAEIAYLKFISTELATQG